MSYTMMIPFPNVQTSYRGFEPQGLPPQIVPFFMPDTRSIGYGGCFPGTGDFRGFFPPIAEMRGVQTPAGIIPVPQQPSSAIITIRLPNIDLTNDLRVTQTIQEMLPEVARQVLTAAHAERTRGGCQVSGGYGPGGGSISVSCGFNF